MCSVEPSRRATSTSLAVGILRRPVASCQHASGRPRAARRRRRRAAPQLLLSGARVSSSTTRPGSSSCSDSKLACRLGHDPGVGVGDPARLRSPISGPRQREVGRRRAAHDEQLGAGPRQPLSSGRLHRTRAAGRVEDHASPLAQLAQLPPRASARRCACVAASVVELLTAAVAGGDPRRPLAHRVGGDHRPPRAPRERSGERRLAGRRQPADHDRQRRCARASTCARRAATSSPPARADARGPRRRVGGRRSAATLARTKAWWAP